MLVDLFSEFTDFGERRRLSIPEWLISDPHITCSAADTTSRRFVGMAMTPGATTTYFRFVQMKVQQ